MLACSPWAYTVPGVAKEQDKGALDKWRKAEAAYADAVAGYMKGEAPVLGKAELVEMTRLRSKADRWRERFFKSGV